MPAGCEGRFCIDMTEDKKPRDDGASPAKDGTDPERVPAPQQAPVEYRWSYAEQAAFDGSLRKRKKRFGAAAFVWTMTLAFAVCIGILVGVVALQNRAPVGVVTSGSELTTAEISARVTPATVLISSLSSTAIEYGTGFFIRQDGYLLTNSHVVSGAKQVYVTLYSGEQLEAEVLWSSAPDDLAILRVTGRNYPTVTIGNSDTLQVGERAVAVGNPAGTKCTWSTTQGVISAVDRIVTEEGANAIVDMTMIQTDTPLNPGNSGGPLCNARGEVIGVVCRKLNNYESLSFVIPISGAMELVDAYLRTGSTDSVQSRVSRVRPTIGIQVTEIKKGEQFLLDYEYVAPADCLLVTAVTAGGPADGKLEAGDLILGIDGQTVHSFDDVKAILYEHRAGDEVTLTVDRLGERLEITIRFAAATS